MSSRHVERCRDQKDGPYVGHDHSLPDVRSGMAYTAEEMEEISRDPVRLRRYFMGVAMNARRMALRDRQKSRRMGLAYPVTGYKLAFEEGRDLMRWAATMDAVAGAICEHIDAFVESSLER